MSSKTQNEIIFGLIAEEISPPPAKKEVEPIPRVVSVQRPLSPSAFESAIQRRTVPLRLLEASVKIESGVVAQMDTQELMRYVQQTLTEALVRELIALLEIEKQYDICNDVTLYRAAIHVALPKEIRGKRSVDVMEWDGMGGITKSGVMT